MSPKAGEKVKKTATYYCKGCDYAMRIIRGATLPPCPCGSSDYRIGRNQKRRGSG